MPDYEPHSMSVCGIQTSSRGHSLTACTVCPQDASSQIPQSVPYVCWVWEPFWWQPEGRENSFCVYISTLSRFLSLLPSLILSSILFSPPIHKLSNSPSPGIGLPCGCLTVRIFSVGPCGVIAGVQAGCPCEFGEHIRHSIILLVLYTDMYIKTILSQGIPQRLRSMGQSNPSLNIKQQSVCECICVNELLKKDWQTKQTADG